MNDQAEKEGIKAIIGLQGLAGKVESKDQARAGWRAMSDKEKARTIEIYNWLQDTDWVVL